MLRVGVDMVAEIGQPCVSNTTKVETRRSLARGQFAQRPHRVFARLSQRTALDLRQHQRRHVGDLGGKERAFPSTTSPCRARAKMRQCRVSCSGWRARFRSSSTIDTFALSGLDLGDVAFGDPRLAASSRRDMSRSRRMARTRSPSSPRNSVSDIGMDQAASPEP